MLAAFAIGYTRISSPTLTCHGRRQHGDGGTVILGTRKSQAFWISAAQPRPVIIAAAALCRMIHKFSRDPVLGISPSPLAVPDAGKTGRRAVFSRRSFEANPHGGSSSIDSQSARRRADVVQC